jgi:hypothetical protein
MTSTEAGMEIEQMDGLHEENMSLSSFVTFDEIGNRNSPEEERIQHFLDIRRSESSTFVRKRPN